MDGQTQSHLLSVLETAPGLSKSVRKLAATLLRFKDAHPTIEQLQRIADVKRDSVMRGLNELERRNIIRRLYKASPTGTNVYQFLDSSLWITDLKLPRLSPAAMFVVREYERQLEAYKVAKKLGLTAALAG